MGRYSKRRCDLSGPASARSGTATWTRAADDIADREMAVGCVRNPITGASYRQIVPAFERLYSGDLASLKNGQDIGPYCWRRNGRYWCPLNDSVRTATAGLKTGCV